MYETAVPAAFQDRSKVGMLDFTFEIGFWERLRVGIRINWRLRLPQGRGEAKYPLKSWENATKCTNYCA
jgi:hypothetical protein